MNISNHDAFPISSFRTRVFFVDPMVGLLFDLLSVLSIKLTGRLGYINKEITFYVLDGLYVGIL